jgi:Sporulation and spore germination
MTPRRLATALVVFLAAVALGWGLMTMLSRALRTPEPRDEETPPVAAAPELAGPAVPRIRVKLFFASEDGRSLVAVEREVPLGNSLVAQARALVQAQLTEAPPEPLAGTIPAGTALRGLFLSDRNAAFVDLDSTIRVKHPGGSMNELLTVYTIVNAVTVNLPVVEQVQVLIDGREVDTLAGHVDLRQPLRKNESLIQP